MRTPSPSSPPLIARRTVWFMVLLESPMAILSVFLILMGWSRLLEGDFGRFWELGMVSAFLTIGLGIYLFKWGIATGMVKGKQAANIWATNGIYVVVMFLSMTIVSFLSASNDPELVLGLGLYLIPAAYLSLKSYEATLQQVEAVAPTEPQV